MRYSEHQSEETSEAEAETVAAQRVGKETLSGQIRRRAAGPDRTADPGAAFSQATATPSQEIPFRADMERSFSQDFSGVQAHVGEGSKGGLGQLGALAAAQGEEVAFAETSPSRETVAHELTHVVQARGGQDGVHGKSALSSPGDAAEVEADQVAARVVAGESAQVSAAPSAGISRIPDPTLGTPAPGIATQEVFGEFTLPAHRILVDGGGITGTNIETTSATQVRVSVSASGIQLHASPPIHLDAPYPVNNMNVFGARYDFATGAVTVDVAIDEDGWGFLDKTQTARDSISATVTSALAGTPAATRGYNPMTDPDPMHLVTALGAKFHSLPAGAGGGGPTPADMTNVAAGGTFSARSALDLGAGDGSVHIPAGGIFTITVQGGGSVAALSGAATPQAAGDAAAIQSIHLESQAIEIRAGGSPVARLDEATVLRGGQVRVQRIHMLGTGATLEGVEALVSILAGTLQAGSQGASPELAFQIGVNNASTQIVPGVTKQILEEHLTTAIQQLLRDNAHALPGLDLAEIFGVAAAPAAPGGGAPPRH